MFSNLAVYDDRSMCSGISALIRSLNPSLRAGSHVREPTPLPIRGTARPPLAVSPLHAFVWMLPALFTAGSTGRAQVPIPSAKDAPEVSAGESGQPVPMRLGALRRVQLLSVTRGIPPGRDSIYFATENLVQSTSDQDLWHAEISFHAEVVAESHESDAAVALSQPIATVRLPQAPLRSSDLLRWREAWDATFAWEVLPAPDRNLIVYFDRATKTCQFIDCATSQVVLERGEVDAMFDVHSDPDGLELLTSSGPELHYLHFDRSYRLLEQRTEELRAGAIYSARLLLDRAEGRSTTMGLAAVIKEAVSWRLETFNFAGDEAASVGLALDCPHSNRHSIALAADCTTSSRRFCVTNTGFHNGVGIALTAVQEARIELTVTGERIGQGLSRLRDCRGRDESKADRIVAGGRLGHRCASVIDVNGDDVRDFCLSMPDDTFGSKLLLLSGTNASKLAEFSSSGTSMGLSLSTVPNGEFVLVGGIELGSTDHPRNPGTARLLKISPGGRPLREMAHWVSPGHN